MVDLIVLVLIITFLYTFQVRMGICLSALSEMQPVYTIYMYFFPVRIWNVVV